MKGRQIVWTAAISLAVVLAYHYYLGNGNGVMAGLKR